MTAGVIQVEYDVLEAIAARLGRESLATLELMRRLERLVPALPGFPAGEFPAAIGPAIEGEILPALGRLAVALAEGQAASRQIIAILQQAEQQVAQS